MKDADYIHAFQKIVMPIAMEFAPQLVISEFQAPSFYAYMLIQPQSLPDLMPQKATSWASAMSVQLAMHI